MIKLKIAGGVFAAMSVASVTQAAVSDSDRAFLVQEVQGARYELALARTAQTKASKPQIRTYAARIVHDHEMANAELMRLVKQEGLHPPAGMSDSDTAKLAKLNAMTGPAYDKAYVDEVTRINAQDKQTGDKETADTHDVRIKAYLKRFAGMDSTHEKLGEQLKPIVG